MACIRTDTEADRGADRGRKEIGRQMDFWRIHSESDVIYKAVHAVSCISGLPIVWEGG